MTYSPPVGNAVALEFLGSYTPQAGNSANLNFLAPIGQNTPADIGFTTDDVSISISAFQPIDANISFTVDDVSVEVVANYDSAVFRGLTASTASAHQQASTLHRQERDSWQQPTAKRPQRGDLWRMANALPSAISVDTGSNPQPTPSTSSDGWNEAQALIDGGIAIKHVSPLQKYQTSRETWDEVLAKAWTVNADWRNPPPKRIHRASMFEAATASSLAKTLGSNQAPRKLKDQRKIPWGDANPHNWIIGWPVEIVPTPPRVWSSDLVFSCKKPAWVDGLTTDLIFKPYGCPWQGQTPGNATIIVPVLRSYFVSNQASVVTLPGLVPLDVTSLNISSDIDNWCWSFSATLKTSNQLSLIQPVNGNPVEIRATVNGVIWEFIVEGYGHNREFANTGINIKGRSKSAYLAEPYAAIGNDSNGFDILAQQIADGAVTNTGFTIDWQVADWLVTSGAWNHRGTPLARLTTLAEAIGASVQSATQLNRISIVKRYPILPWDWAAATPYAQIPLDIILAMGVEWVKKPEYNAVYVSGESAGVTAQIKRTGTAGDLLAPMAVSPLITHADAARMRGESILADTGAQGKVSITVPMDNTLSMVPPGKLIEIDDAVPWRGLTRGVSINAQWQQGLTIRQQLEVERHYG